MAFSSDALKSHAIALGFDRCGVAPAGALERVGAVGVVDGGGDDYGSGRGLGDAQIAALLRGAREVGHRPRVAAAQPGLEEGLLGEGPDRRDAAAVEPQLQRVRLDVGGGHGWFMGAWVHGCIGRALPHELMHL